MRGIDNYFSRKQLQLTDWDSLSMEEKSALLQAALELGITDIDRIKWEYNNRNNPNKDDLLEEEQSEPTKQLLYDLYNKVEGKRKARKGNSFANLFENGGDTNDSTEGMYLTEFGTTKSHKGKSKAPKEIQLTRDEIREILKDLPFQTFDFKEIKDKKKRPLQEPTTFIYVPHSFIKKIYPDLHIPSDGNSVTYYFEETSSTDEKGRYTLHKLDLDSKMGKFYTDFKLDQERYKKYMNNPNPYNLETVGIPLEEVTATYDKKLNKLLFKEDNQPLDTSTSSIAPLIQDTLSSGSSNGNSDKSYINPFGYTGGEENLPIGDNNLSGVVGGHLFGENSGREIMRDPDEGINIGYSYPYSYPGGYGYPGNVGSYPSGAPYGGGNQTVHINWPSNYTLPDYSGEYGIDPLAVPVDRLPAVEGDNINLNDLYYWLLELFRRNNMSSNTYEEFALPKRRERIVPQLLTSLPLYESKVFNNGNLFKHGGLKRNGKKKELKEVKSRPINWYVDNKYAKYATNEFEYNGVKYATLPSLYGAGLKSIDYETGKDLGYTNTVMVYYDENRKLWKVIDAKRDKNHILNLNAHALKVALEKVLEDLEIARGTKAGEEKIVPYTTNLDGTDMKRLSYFHKPYSEMYNPEEAALNAYDYDMKIGHLPSVRASFKPASGYSDLDALWYSANLPNINVGINGGEYNDGSYSNGNAKYSKNASWNALVERSKDIILSQWNQSKDAAEIKDRKISENIRKNSIEDNPGLALDLFVIKPGIMGLMAYGALTNPATTALALTGFGIGSDIWNSAEAGIEPMDYLRYKATGKDFESIKHLRGKTWDEKVQEALTPIIGEALAEEVAPFTNIGGLVGGGMGKFGREFDKAGKDLISSITSKRRANNDIFSAPENYLVRNYLDDYYKRILREGTYKELGEELNGNVKNYGINGYVKVGDKTPSNTKYTGSTYSYNNGKTLVPINNRTSTSTKLLAAAGDLNKESMRGAAASEVFRRPKLGKSLKEDYKPDFKEAKRTEGVEAVVEPEEINLNKINKLSATNPRNNDVHGNNKSLNEQNIASDDEIQALFEQIIRKELENARVKAELTINDYYNNGDVLNSKAVEDLRKAGASKEKAELYALDMYDNISTTAFTGFNDLSSHGEGVLGVYNQGYGKGYNNGNMTVDEYLNMPEEYRTFNPEYSLDPTVINPLEVLNNVFHELGGHGADLAFNMSETFDNTTLQNTHMLDALEGWFPSAKEIYLHNLNYSPEVRPEFRPDSKEMKKLAKKDPEAYLSIMEDIEYLLDPAEYTARARANRIYLVSHPNEEIGDIKSLRTIFTDESVDRMLNNVYSVMGDVNKESVRGAALTSLRDLNTKVKNKEIGVLDAMAKQEQIASELNNTITPNNQPLDWSPESWFKGRPKGQEPTPEEIAAFEERVPEYEEIQRKAGDDWLKMPDGSTWKGDPREWVMMQSKDYKNFMKDSKYLTPMTHLIGDFEGNQIKEVPSTGGGRLYGNGFYGYSNPTGELHTGLSTTSTEYPLIGAEPQATFVVNSKNPVGLTSIDVTPNIFNIGLRHSEERVGSFHNPNFPEEGIGPYFDKDIGITKGRKGLNIVVSGFPNSRGEAFPATKFITGNTGEFSTNPGSGVLRAVAGDLNEESIRGAVGNVSKKIGKLLKDAYRFGKGYRKELKEVNEKWRNARDESNKISTVDIPAENNLYIMQMASYKDRAMAQLENEEGKYVSVPTSEINLNDLQTAANSNVFYGPKLKVTEDGNSFKVTGGPESTVSQKDYNIPIFDDSSTVNRVTGTIELIPYEETSNSIAVDPNSIESSTFLKIMELLSPGMAVYKPSGAEQYLLDMGITEPSFTFEVSGGAGWGVGRGDVRGYTADRVNAYNDYSLEPNITPATKPVNVDVSSAAVSGEVPLLPKDLQLVAANNIEYILKEIPGAVVFGSSKMTAEGVVARDFGDFDTYYPASKLKDLDLSRLGTSVNGETYPYQLDPVNRKYANRDENGRIKTNKKGEEDWGIVDLNIVKVDPKTGIGNARALQIYRLFFPEEWLQSVTKAAAEGKTEVPIVDMNGKPISDVELLSKYDPIDGTFMDAVEANFLDNPTFKGKHAGRFFNYMIGNRPDVIHSAFNRIAKMAFGKNGHLLPKLKFGTPEENYQILIGLNYPKNAAKIISKDPAKMLNALDYWYLSEMTPFRAIGPGDMGSTTGTLETINRNATTWSERAVGGTTSGGGLNTVIGGTSGYEGHSPLVVRSQPNIKGVKEGMKAEDAIAEINRSMGFGKLTLGDLDVAASLGIDVKRLKVGDDVSNMHSAIMLSGSISKRKVEDIYNDFLDKTNRVGLIGGRYHTGTYFGSKNLNVSQGDAYGINAGKVLGDKRGNYYDIMGLNKRSEFLKGQNITSNDILNLYRSAATIKAKEKITKKLYEIFDNDKELLKIEQLIKDITKEIEKLLKDLKYSNKKMDRYSKLASRLSNALYKRDRIIGNMKLFLATVGLGTAVVGAGVVLAYTSSSETSPAKVRRERRKNERDYNDLIKLGTNRRLSTKDNEKLEKIKMLSSVGFYDIPANELKYWTKEDIRKLVKETKDTEEKRRKPNSKNRRK